MMEWTSAYQLIGAFAECVVRLDECARNLRVHPAVVSVRTEFAPRRYESGVVIEAYVDADMSDERSMAWTLDISIHELGWTLEGCLRVTTLSGQERVAEFASASGTTQQRLVIELRLATTKLVEHVDLRIGPR